MQDENAVGRDQLAEYAEALGLRTDQVVGHLREGDVVMVLFREAGVSETGDLTGVEGAFLKRDGDGILQDHGRMPLPALEQVQDAA